MFGYRLIKHEKLKLLECYEIKYHKMLQARYWFSGWKDLEILFDYIALDTNFGGIELARKNYAEARNTDEYGVKK